MSEDDGVANAPPLIGRSEELALLRRRLKQATDGAGQVVLISAEPGIGKSRMLQELLRGQESAESYVQITLQCSPYHVASALHPVREAFEEALGLARESDDAHAITRLDEWAYELQLTGRASWALSRLLGIIKASPEFDALSSERQREIQLAGLVEVLAAMAAQTPLIVVAEDCTG